jgi:peptidoglycan DL-endopeptidase CwlO
VSVPRPTSTLLKSLSVVGATVLLVGVGATGGQAAPAADPPPSTSGQAASELQAVSARLQQVSTRYAAAQRLLGTRTAQATLAQARAERAAKAAAAYRGEIKRLVSSESRSDPFGTFGAMLSSGSPGDFAAKVSLIDVVASRRADTLSAAARASATAARSAADARAAAGAAATVTRELAAQRTELTAQVGQSKALYDRLSAAERRAFLAAAGERQERAERAARAARAAADARARAQAPAPRASASAPAPTRALPAPPRTQPGTQPPPAQPPRSRPAPPSVPASGRAAVAVASARAQIGKPYVWGATGPGSFDCSGLTSYVWRQAGVSLPRTSRDQYAAGVKVSRSQLRPGDLVYFGSPIYHVAIYIGGGQMITAPQPGEVVKYQALSTFSDYTGATRPG